ncbi:pentapeptide repeat-containing protein [Marivivens marinus]|uniref:pentapeptide repeat-containing protein n=1 Tax=Marivivens marinus TaxID=3110173 RepID=UPI003B849E91
MGTESLFQLTFPPVTVLDTVVWTLLAVVAGCLWIYLWISASARQDQSKRLGSLFGMSPGIAVAITVIIAPLFLAALAASFSVLLRTVVNPSLATGLGTGALIAATLGAPFLIWRSIVAQKTVDHAAKSLFNDKINAAVQDLYAQRQVTKVDKRNKGQMFNAWQDDVVKRNAAIDRLFGLAEEAADKDPKEVHRIASMLSVYVRELSKEPDLRAKTPPKGASPQEMRDWARNLEIARSDMEKAVQTLGKLRRLIAEDVDKAKIDLRDANLQRMDLQSLDFVAANLRRAKLQGANLFLAELQGANLSGAELQGADLSGAELQGANLIWAELQGANLIRAELQGANLSEAKFDDATNLTAATLRGAAVRLVDDTTIARLRSFFDDIFADGGLFGQDDSNRTLPNGADWPDHWPREELDFGDFLKAWRAWQCTLDPPLPPEALPEDG